MSYLYPAVTPCHDAFVLPYAAYLRVYEPLSAFSGAEARHWLTYAVPARPAAPGLRARRPSTRTRCGGSILVRQDMVPAWESGDAYVRWVDGTTYICPWQTRLRSWLGLSRLRAAFPQLWSAAFTADEVETAVSSFARRPGHASSLRVHIQTRAWSVPPAWFVPFPPHERWLVLGAGGDPGDGGRATATPTRTLIYATTMARGRRRPGGRWLPSAAPGCRRGPASPQTRRRGW